ncbi:tripartite tricarboxylate transporter substrate binding protein [Pusillimonas sp. SM2304]|uniref:Bug family tripartite tricarboxylate transporter substrate binding protein n=1 Tax=Pusillimonas sp. SM2304 TaxID=3073241 RepID=UPI0028748D64|nr:tripartite tricarboxylate transporter substrate binding protein [Pusillimonas sp. SM2304]MDS1140021.1 tripartite tricarboxylate transporter substrate binding protein [Pusillimonas sp. SM2304]
MKISKLCVAAVLAATAFSAAAQTSYPDRPITIVVAFAAGGGTDLAARYYAKHFSEALGQPVVVENKAGANGTIAAAYVAKAPADGYTLLYGSNSTLSAAPYLYSNLRYDPINDFDAVVRLGDVPSVLIASPDAPYDTFDDFLAYAKANPGKLSWAHANTAHIAGGMSLVKKAGLDMVEIPYKSSPQGITDVIGNQIPLMVVDLSAAMSYVQSSRVKPLAVTSAERTPSLPDLPAMSERYPGIDVFSWTGLVAPKGTPKAIIDKLNKIGTEIALRPEVVKHFQDTAAMDTTKTGTPEAFSDFIGEQLKSWDAMLTEAGVPRQ